MYYEQQKNVLPILGPIPMLGYCWGRCRQKWSPRCWRVLSRISRTLRFPSPRALVARLHPSLLVPLLLRKGIPWLPRKDCRPLLGTRKRSRLWRLLLNRSLFCRSRPWLYGRWLPPDERLMFLLKLRRNRSLFPMTYRSLQRFQPRGCWVWDCCHVFVRGSSVAPAYVRSPPEEGSTNFIARTDGLFCGGSRSGYP